ncbi:MAG: alginate export family protein [Acidobacteria bacterium]|jgi:hypothetical protein|nr:alginate export family protein [Acidobacteriota bacterium]
MAARRPPALPVLLAVAAALAVVAATPVAALPAAAPSSPEQPIEDPNARQLIPTGLAEGFPIELVYVHLVDPTGVAAQDDTLRQQVADAFRVQPGAIFNQFVADAAASRVRALPFVRELRVRLYTVSGGRQVAVALLVTRQPDEVRAPTAATGAIATGSAADLPTLWQDERSLLKLIFNPAAGAYVDRDAWLANPGAFVGLPDQDPTTTVFEAGLEVGIGGITRLGGANAYLYGAASYIGSMTLGQDIYTDEHRRSHGEIEDAYLGLLLPGSQNQPTFNFSFGRQKYSLNRNILIGHVLGASNGGVRAAANLSPRNAYDMAIEASLQYRDFTAQAWYANPNELPASNSSSRFTGLNLRYNNNRNVDASLLVLTVPHSLTRYVLPDGTRLSREGLWAVNPRIRWTSAFGVAGLWLEGEWAHEWNADYDMSADGGGAWIGYTASDLAWKPGILYRYAVFTGDDPETETFERFDTLTGGVQRDWAQGMDGIKIFANRNLRTHRVELSAEAAAGLNLSIDYYYFQADTLNNLGGQPAVASYGSDTLAQEITPTLQWTVNDHLYVQSFLSFLRPGPGLRQVLPEPTDTWKTFQLSFYMFY